MDSLEKVLTAYKEKQPEVVFEWKDAETEAQGWVVINSLKNGAAGGGTRMRLGLTKDEVVSLAKVMEIKFGVCGPPIGGAKSGINFDPRDPRKDEVLKRWYKAVIPILKYYYGTGGDLNVDELKDVIPITEDLGLWHPQEGVVNGHIKPSDGDKISIIGQLRYGCAKVVESLDYVPDTSKNYAVADMITGWGVSESVKHYYSIYKDTDLVGKRAIIQGWGNVASAAAFYLAKLGVKIVGIIDRVGGVIKEEGFSLEEVETMFVEKDGNALNHPDMQSFEAINQAIWSVKADIFIPGAASKLVTKDQVDAMMNSGVELISCGANVPFIDDKIFFGETAKYVDSKIAVIPDFVANCGMARVFAYLMQSNAKMTDQAIFDDASETIRAFMASVYEVNNEPVNIATKSLKYVLTSK